MPLSIMTFSITTHSINITKCDITLTKLDADLVMLSVSSKPIMLNVIVQSVIMLSVAAPLEGYIRSYLKIEQ